MTSAIGPFDERSQPSRDPREPIPTPWESFSAVAELVHRRKVGVVVELGTPEASLGTDLAVHAAEVGIPTLLCAPCRPPHVPSLLMVDTDARPTASRVNEHLQAHHRGREFEFLVVEHYDRMSPDEYPYAERYDPIDDLDHEPLTPADELLRSVQLIRTSFPSLFTTALPSTPDTSRSLLQTLDIDHPASVLTDACKPVLTLHRTDLRTVQARIELSSHPGPQLVTLPWPTIPAMRTLAELRQALTAHGAADDRVLLDADIDGVDLDDLDRIRGIVRVYRQRVIQKAATAILPSPHTDE
ncbi:hypothetical protein [Streptomyces hydrogenans]|uniref:Uncharacterized protein n=1 Tax=Streptomyces hydrogenans TaxID=1873719 RepID=A0ABQ3PQQ4_9ACTN|nr:hypothetical protein [Streptomyces hydrogenans]GHF98502.1 hypothetical protein GCM10018784_07550 [Streptomyces hydrogenans]GHI27356.1 hypothetical protein Shyd_87270 [Streptomyces hydrogenans]